MSQIKVYDTALGQWVSAVVGATGPTGPTGPTGATGATGPGVASGGTTGQVLVKDSSVTDYITAWQSLAITDADIASSANIAQSKIANPPDPSYWSSSVAYGVGSFVWYDNKVFRCKVATSLDANDPLTDTDSWQLFWFDHNTDPFRPVVGVETHPRISVNVGRTLGNGQLYITWFMASKTVTVSNVTIHPTTGYTSSGVPLFQAGIFMPSDASGNYSYPKTSNVTHVKCLSRGTLPNASMATTSVFTSSLDFAVTLTAGQIYGFGIIGSVSPSFTVGSVVAGNGYNSSNIPLTLTPNSMSGVAGPGTLTLNSVYTCQTSTVVLSVSPYARLT